MVDLTKEGLQEARATLRAGRHSSLYLCLHRDAWFLCWVLDLNHRVDDNNCITWPSDIKEAVIMGAVKKDNEEWEDRIINGDGSGKAPEGIFNVKNKF